MKMTEDRFWYIVDKLDWKNNQDYKVLGLKFLNYINSRIEIGEMRNFSKIFRINKINRIIDEDGLS